MSPIQLFFYVMAFFFGACVGSFLNVVIYRLPAGLSVVSPPSHCPVCRYKIPFYMNVPVLSYLFLRGRCAGCRTRISLRYPGVELLTGALGLGAAVKFGATAGALYWFALGAVLIAVSFIDLDHRIIPDSLTLPGILVFAASGLVFDEMDMVSVTLGIAAGSGILFLADRGYCLLRGRHGMGGGDMKLLAMIGAATGISGISFTLFAGAVLGICAGTLLPALRRSRKKDPRIPFGPFLSAGAMAYVFAGHELICWYTGLIQGG